MATFHDCHSASCRTVEFHICHDSICGVSTPASLTTRELGMVDIIRANAAERRTEIKWKRRFFNRCEVDFHWQSRQSTWGRFGGGWQWKLGFEAGSWRSFVLNLLVCRIGVWIGRREPVTPIACTQIARNCGCGAELNEADRLRNTHDCNGKLTCYNCYVRLCENTQAEEEAQMALGLSDIGDRQ